MLQVRILLGQQMNLSPGELALFKERCPMCVRSRHFRCFNTSEPCSQSEVGINVSVVRDELNFLSRIFITTSGVQVGQLRMNHCTALDAAQVKLDAIEKYSKQSNDKDATRHQ